MIIFFIILQFHFIKELFLNLWSSYLNQIINIKLVKKVFIRKIVFT